MHRDVGEAHPDANGMQRLRHRDDVRMLHEHLGLGRFVPMGYQQGDAQRPSRCHCDGLDASGQNDTPTPPTCLSFPYLLDLRSLLTITYSLAITSTYCLTTTMLLYRNLLLL